MAQKPSIPKGTRDFSPAEVAKRNYIFSTIKTNFEKFGFQPIETPSFENSETLMGKYGEEGDRLIFKILNSGDYLNNIDKLFYHLLYVFDEQNLILKFNDVSNNYNKNINLVQDSWDLEIKLFLESRLGDISTFLNNSEYKIIFQKLTIDYTTSDKLFVFYKRHFESDSYIKKEKQNLFISQFERDLKELISEIIKKNINSITNNFSEKALRYDLTVPFARYLVQHQNDIEFPFKRYQIQPVWRADRPQKGRFREFYQCDADVVGSNSLWQEVELVQLYDSVFSELGLGDVTIKINNRKILSGIAEVIGASDKLIDFTVALDKLDKIGEDGVKNEMLEKGISESAIEKVQPLFDFSGTINEKIEKLGQLLANSEEGMKGVNELQFICDNVSTLGLQTAFLDLDVTLARGLNYYTGAIFEVAAPKGVAMGSIGGGGRYDDLTGIFGLKNMSGVGISFGLDRIALVMEEVGLFPATVLATSKALFLNFGDKEALYAMKAIGKLRQKGIKVELYPDNSKIDKQFKHADRRGIPFAVIVGESEIESEEFGLKNLATGEQQKVDFETLVTLLQ
jgi:histidyl-tRNA synthetase